MRHNKERENMKIDYAIMRHNKERENMKIDVVRAEMETKAAVATREFMARHFGGSDGGPCGFAWVTIFPKHKGNTKLGKLERQVYKSLGARADWTGKAYEVWNPGKVPCQSVDAKYAGAAAAAAVLKQYGFEAYPADRMD
jgi:hypothetical protein